MAFFTYAHINKETKSRIVLSKSLNIASKPIGFLPFCVGKIQGMALKI